jgi:hypothetical protein
MDRSIVYTSALPRTVDFLNANKFAMIGNAFAMKGCLGWTGLTPPPPYVEGLACTPTTPTADLNVHIGVGSIYQVDNTDATAYGDLGTDTNNILKQGILYNPVTLAITPPATPGYSQVYLVQAALQDLDGGSQVLPYYNAANPTQPYSGPANSGTSQFTTRTSICAVALKAGVAAPTGSQLVPTPDVNYAALYQVTVANGQTQITGANIALSPIAPFFPTLPSIPVHIQNGDWISADDTGTTNSLVITVIPALTGLLKYQKFRFKVKNTNTGPATLQVSGYTGSIYLPGQLPSALPSGALIANSYAEVICDGINFEMVVGSLTVNNNSYTTGSTAGLTNVQVFTASGTYIPTTGATKALVFATGGGGSGANVCGAAGGGGAGATAIALLSLSGVSSVVVTIGAGGAASSGGTAHASGNPGGTTTFGSYASAGGGGAAFLTNGLDQGGPGGTATVGLLLIPGGDGDSGNPANITASGATGGPSFWGGGGNGNFTYPSTGNPGRSYGSGGAGGYDASSGAGKSGVVMVMEF